MTENRRKNKLKLLLLLLILVMISVIMIYNAAKLGVRTIYPMQYTDIVETNAERFGLDKSMLYALIKSESGFDKDAVSSVGALGLTQITPETFEWLQTKTKENYSDEALFEPEISIYYGAYFLDMLLREFENTETAFAAYHAGRGIVNEWLADPKYSKDGKTLETIPYGDTSEYVKKVMKNIERYKKIYDIK